MEWYQLISFLFTNSIRIVVGFLLVREVLKLPIGIKRTMPLLTGTAVLVTVLQGFLHLSQYPLLAAEILLLAVILVRTCHAKPRMSVFLLIFYEIGIAIWEFLVSAGISILLQQQIFLDSRSNVYLGVVWLVRLILVVFVMILHKNQEQPLNSARVASMLAVITFFAMIMVSEQTRLPLDREVTDSWMLLTLILMFAILIFHLSRQYEMEREVARLQTEQAELIRNDYQNLNRIYTANAKLYHDLHNHMEMMYCYLTQGKLTEAIDYLEDLRAPIQEITQTVWTGEEAIDYLLNSKLSLMHSKQIKTKTNIEFPGNTNIRSAVLTTILGNLLDNAIEAAEKCKEKDRFIYLTVRRINNILIIKVENSFEENPIVEAGELQSSKADKKQHGWGLKSARTAAESYDGSLETSFKENVFCAVATLFF